MSRISCVQSRQLAALCLTFTTSAACGAFTPTVEVAEPGVLEVTTEPGITLEVLDWGGNGQALIFLAGGNHTAHEFDEFAPLLTDEFRVFGITRRGIGASSGTSPQHLDDHVNDIVAVIETLDLGSVVLVGHSFAGVEMARFGALHDDRCLGLVYLDSAYDYTDPDLPVLFETTPPPRGPGMTRADSASVEAVRAFIERDQGFSLPESEIRATRVFDEFGRFVGRAPSTSGRIESIVTPWESVECRALGLYAVTAPLQTWWPYYAAVYDSLSPESREQGEAYVRAFGVWTKKHRDAFGRLPQNEVVEFPGTGHYFFLRKPQEAAAAIRDFVSRL